MTIMSFADLQQSTDGFGCAHHANHRFPFNAEIETMLLCFMTHTHTGRRSHHNSSGGSLIYAIKQKSNYSGETMANLGNVASSSKQLQANPKQTINILFSVKVAPSTS